MNHKSMSKEGEQWMKDMTTTCSVVGTLVVGIMFAVAITVPGGNRQETGLPLFSNDKIIYSLYSVRCLIPPFFLNFVVDLFGNMHIALRRRRFSRIFANKDNDRSFHPPILYHNHDDCLFCCSFNYAM